MSIARYATAALATAAFGVTLMTGASAYADNYPVANRAKSRPAPSLTRQSVASGERRLVRAGCP